MYNKYNRCTTDVISSLLIKCKEGKRHFSWFSYYSKATLKHMGTVTVLLQLHPYIIMTVSVVDSSRNCPYTIFQA